MCMCIALKGHPQNDLCSVRQNVKPYSLIHPFILYTLTVNIENLKTFFQRNVCFFVS